MARHDIFLDSPLIQEILAEIERDVIQKDLLLFLEARFESVPAEIAAAVCAVADNESLQRLLRSIARCDSLEEVWHILFATLRQQRLDCDQQPFIVEGLPCVPSG